MIFVLLGFTYVLKLFSNVGFILGSTDGEVLGYTARVLDGL